VSTPGRPEAGKIPTVRDVAVAARVSVATVSRVLNGDPRVQPERRDRVEAAIRQLGYRRDSVARNLRRGSTMVWGLVISDIENPFFTSLVRGVQDTAEQAGYSVVLLNSDEDLEKEARCLRVLAEERVAGVILSPVSERDSTLTGLPASTPTVLVDRQITGLEIDTVAVDHAGGSYEGTAHLLREGYRRVGCISGPRHSTTGASRIEGYEQALRDAGHAPDPELICTTDFKRGGGYESALRLLDLDSRPDAIIAMNNLMTEGTLWALQERGLAVPEDVGVVGFDDQSWSTLVRPRLTVVAQPVRQLGVRAAELLTQRCRGDRSGFPATVRLPPQLTVRESSGRQAPEP
jgi:LacI family transcriptional regulator